MFKAHQQAKGKAEMKHTREIWIGALLITILLSQTACGLVSETAQPKVELPKPAATYEIDPTSTPDLKANTTDDPLPTQAEDVQKIRNATVLIRMQTPQSKKVAGTGVYLGSGMGSLIQYNGQIILVTHNHWGELLQDLTIVEFRNADNRMIKPIYGYEFKKQIVFQDAGTIVLRPPQELIDQLVPVNLDAIPQIAAGETVDVVYRENPAREKAAIHPAVVEEIITYKGLPVYRLRSLDGQPIFPGDSGGGIWYKGVLVGNNWGTITETNGSDAGTSENSEEENIVYTDLSFVAILPLDLP